MDVIYTNRSIKPVMESKESKIPEVPTVTSADIMGNANGKVKLEDDEGVRSISFHNVTYMVEQRKCFKKRPPKVILNNVRYSYIPTIDSSYI